MVCVDRFFPSSKKCCKCGSIKKESETLTEYIFVHGNLIDRDLNAAIIIREEVHAGRC